MFLNVIVEGKKLLILTSNNNKKVTIFTKVASFLSFILFWSPHLIYFIWLLNFKILFYFILFYLVFELCSIYICSNFEMSIFFVFNFKK